MNLNAMARALGGEASGGQVLCPGPGHSRKDRSLAVRLTREGRILCHSFAGDDSRVCQEHVRAALGLPSDAWRGNHPQGSHNRHLERLKPRSGDHKDLALSIWRDSGEPRDTLVEKYLASRRLELPQKAAGEVIRFHPACPFGAERFPALICLVRNIRTNQPQAIQRTALNPDGKAVKRNGKTFRKTLAPMAGGAVKIDADERVTQGLCIGEGLETTLSGRAYGCRPAWAVLSDTGIRDFPVLSGVDSLTIFLENDANGANARAARECIERWQSAGREVFTLRPDAGNDLNDELCANEARDADVLKNPTRRAGETAAFGGASETLVVTTSLEGTAMPKLEKCEPREDARAASRDDLLIASWMTAELPERDYLLGEVLSTTSRWLLVGETGIGKTLLSLEIAASIAKGCGFLGWEGGRPARVMYIDGELPAETFKERLSLIAAQYGSDIELFAYNRDRQAQLGLPDIPPLNTPAGQQWLWREIGIVKPDAITFDSVMSLLIGTMGDEESWQPMKPFIKEISIKRIAQIWLHHTGHDPSKSFGTKTREWEMDTVIMLSKFESEGNEPQASAAFHLEFTKARLKTPANYHQFSRRIVRWDENEGRFVSEEGGPRSSTSQAEIIRRAIIDAYEFLADGVRPSPGFDRVPVKKVKADAMRDNVKDRGYLDTDEKGNITGAARMQYQRAKSVLLGGKGFVEEKGQFWRVRDATKGNSSRHIHESMGRCDVTQIPEGQAASHTSPHTASHVTQRAFTEEKKSKNAGEETPKNPPRNGGCDAGCDTNSGAKNERCVTSRKSADVTQMQPSLSPAASRGARIIASLL
jgi:hypothetical protein